MLGVSTEEAPLFAEAPRQSFGFGRLPGQCCRGQDKKHSSSCTHPSMRQNPLHANPTKRMSICECGVSLAFLNSLRRHESIIRHSCQTSKVRRKGLNAHDTHAQGLLGSVSPSCHVTEPKTEGQNSMIVNGDAQQTSLRIQEHHPCTS